MSRFPFAVPALIFLLASASLTFAADLTVGPGKAFARIEDAVAVAKSGDVIVVSEQKENHPYEKVALFIRTPKLTIRADGKQRIPLTGGGFDYSGKGHVPRAIVQVNAGADGFVLEGFELSGAHNGSFNGAGVRIVQANEVTIRRCDIHDNDMGIMSSGDGTDHSAVGQRIVQCLIHANGTDKEPGYNHNLYLGGTSVRLVACEIFGSTTGHNVKSRAHQTFILNCYIHDAANREVDLVDSADTAAPGSDAVLVGNVIVKDPKCAGNRGVIHFGQDGGKERDGTIWLAHNTIVTPFISPVVTLSTAKAKAKFINNLVYDGGHEQKGQVLVDPHAEGSSASGSNNWLSAGFAEKLLATIERSHVAARDERSPLADLAKHDFHPAATSHGVIDAGEKLSAELSKLLGEKLFEYHAPLDRSVREIVGAPDVGAFESKR